MKNSWTSRVTFPFAIQPSFNLWLRMENSGEEPLHKKRRERERGNMQNCAIQGVSDVKRRIPYRLVAESKISLTVATLERRLSLICFFVCLHSCDSSSLSLSRRVTLSLRVAKRYENFMRPLCKFWGEVSWITLELNLIINDSESSKLCKWERKLFSLLKWQCEDFWSREQTT